MPDQPKRSWLQRTFMMTEEEEAAARARGQEWESRVAAGEEAQVAAFTKGWTLPVVLRTYESNAAGEAAFANEAAILAHHDYHPITQSAEGSHLHAGRLLLTGGLSIFAGRSGIRSKGKLTVTFERRAEEVVAAKRVPCERCGESIPAAAAVCRFCGGEYGEDGRLVVPSP